MMNDKYVWHGSDIITEEFIRFWRRMERGEEKELVKRFHKFWDRIDNVLGHDLSWGEINVLVVKAEIFTLEETIRLFGIEVCNGI